MKSANVCALSDAYIYLAEQKKPVEPSEPEKPTKDTDVLEPESRPAKTDPAKDSADQIIPNHLVGIFARATELRSEAAIVNAVLQRTKEAKKIDDPLYMYISLSMLEAEIGNVKRIFNQSLPFAVCAYCGGRGTDCTTCKGTGWTTSVGWAATPEEMKEF